MPLNGPAQPDFKPERTPGGIGNPKAKSFKRASPQRWQEIRERRLGPCYVCLELGVEQELSSTLHHVVAKSLGGHDTEGCVVPLCGDGVRGHHGLVERHDVESCQALARYIQREDDLAYSYAIQHLGENGFLRRYKVAFSRG